MKNSFLAISILALALATAARAETAPQALMGTWKPMPFVRDGARIESNDRYIFTPTEWKIAHVNETIVLPFKISNRSTFYVITHSEPTYKGSSTTIYTLELMPDFKHAHLRIQVNGRNTDMDLAKVSGDPDAAAKVNETIAANEAERKAKPYALYVATNFSILLRGYRENNARFPNQNDADNAKEMLAKIEKIKAESNISQEEIDAAIKERERSEAEASAKASANANYNGQP